MEHSSALHFKGPRSAFSNLYKIEHGIRVWNKTFISVEQAYQWRKCTWHGKQVRADKILQCQDPFRIKWKGTFTTDEQWENNKTKLMWELLCLKARACPEFKSQLIASFPQVLVENTADEFWGRGPDGFGINTLGCLLSQLRSDLLSD